MPKNKGGPYNTPKIRRDDNGKILKKYRKPRKRIPRKRGPKPGKKYPKMSKYTKEAGNKICELIVGGKSLAQIVSDKANEEWGCAKDVGTIIRWRKAHPDFDLQYNQAFSDRADHYIENIENLIEDLKNKKIDVKTFRALVEVDRDWETKSG